MSDSAPLMSLRAYAKRRGCSAMSVSEAVKAGRLKASVGRDAYGQPKISDPDLADREWAANTDASKRINAAGGVDVRAPFEPDHDDDENNPPAKRLKSAQADLAELKYAEAAGNLVDAAEVAREWADVLSRVRSKLLGVPTALKQALPQLTVADVDKIETVIREALEDIVTTEAA